MILKIFTILFGISLLSITAVVEMSQSDLLPSYWILTTKDDTIIRIRADGAVEQRLSPDTLRASSPTWSPDGQWIVFVDTEEMGLFIDDVPYVPRRAFYRVRPDGTQLEQLPVPSSSSSLPLWSPTGEWIAVISRTVEVVERELVIVEYISRMRPDGTEFEFLAKKSNSYGSLFSWSPDGQWILFLGEFTGNIDLYRIRPDGTDLTQLTDDPASERFVQWSPDGEWIAFSSVQDGSRGIFRIRPDGTDYQRVTTHPFSGTIPSWSPDAQWITFSSYQNDRYYIYRIRADGSNLQQLTDDSMSTNLIPQWSPDRQWIVFTDTQNGRTDLYRMRPDGSDKRQLAHDWSHVGLFHRWSPPAKPLPSPRWIVLSGTTSVALGLLLIVQSTYRNRPNQRD